MVDWDKKYSEDDDKSQCEPSLILTELISSLPAGMALDVAAGMGRNSFFLAENGYHVDAVDFSETAIAKGIKIAKEKRLPITFTHVDLTSFPLPPESFDLIINFNYLERSLIPSMKGALKKNGAILFETFTIEQREIGSPRNPDYLLGPNELLGLFGDLHITYYREGVFVERGRENAVATIVARKK